MVQFAVIVKEAQWLVLRDGEVVAHGLSRSEAVRTAENLAFEAEEAGEDVDLVMQGYTGEIRARFSGPG